MSRKAKSGQKRAAAVSASAADPEANADHLSASYLVALAGRLVREVGALARRAGASGKRLPTLTIDTQIGFRSAADRAAFADDLTAAAMLYRDIPVELVTGADRHIARMKEAAKRRDAPGFQAAFSGLTRSCNACHTAGGVAFIHIQTPTAMPFTNQRVPFSGR